MSARPVLLVHGAWAGAWGRGYVQAELERLGVSSTAIDLPSRETGRETTLADDAEAIRAALEGLGALAVLVGHSYAGVPGRSPRSPRPTTGWRTWCTSAPSCRRAASRPAA